MHCIFNFISELFSPISVKKSAQHIRPINTVIKPYRAGKDIQFPVCHIILTGSIKKGITVSRNNNRFLLCSFVFFSLLKSCISSTTKMQPVQNKRGNTVSQCDRKSALFIVSETEPSLPDDMTCIRLGSHTTAVIIAARTEPDKNFIQTSR